MIYLYNPGPLITFPLEEPCFAYVIQAPESGVTAISLQDGVIPCAPWEGQVPYRAAVDQAGRPGAAQQSTRASCAARAPSSRCPGIYRLKQFNPTAIACACVAARVLTRWTAHVAGVSS